MAKNTNKRVPVKHLRDGIKSQYQKKDCCQICGTDEDLELHHPHTFSLLFEQWCKDTGNNPKTDEEVLAIRDDFYACYYNELVVDVLTLCNEHHKKLHQIYGVQPALSTAQKQKIWVERMHAKLNDKELIEAPGEAREPITTGRFTQYLDNQLTDTCNRFTQYLP